MKALKYDMIVVPQEEIWGDQNPAGILAAGQDFEVAQGIESMMAGCYDAQSRDGQLTLDYHEHTGKLTIELSQDDGENWLEYEFTLVRAYTY